MHAGPSNTKPAKKRDNYKEHRARMKILDALFPEEEGSRMSSASKAGRNSQHISDSLRELMAGGRRY